MNSTTNTRSLRNRVALVTGASSGMGAVIATRLAAAGASVAVVGRRADRLADVAGSAPDTGRIVPIGADITVAADVARIVEQTHRQLGTVDLLVNSAGVMLPNPLAEGRTDEWSTMIDTNLTGLLRVTGAFLPDLIEGGRAGGSDIVNISSIAAHAVFPDYAVYAATKAAVTTLSQLQRTEVGRHGVRVTNIEPGLTETELGSHIDNERLRGELDGMYDDLAALAAEDIADLVDYVVTRPPNVNLRQVVVLPTSQA